jgi:hypothetical protein
VADVLSEKLGRCEDECEELKRNVEAVNDRSDSISDRVLGLEYWRNGNGSRGAEARLQTVEGIVADIPAMRADIEVVKIVADAKIERAIKGVMDKRDKTVIAYVKAFGPYVAALAAVVASLWGRV